MRWASLRVNFQQVFGTIQGVAMHPAYDRPMRVACSALLCSILTLAGAACARAADDGSAAWQRADPMIGTGGAGHTFPGATVPFGMIQLRPDTAVRDFKHACAWAAG
jgi:putative alpha-1,2-mannosidase